MHMLLVRTLDDAAPNYCSRCAQEMDEAMARQRERLDVVAAEVREALPNWVRAFQQAADSAGWPGASTESERRLVRPAQRRMFGRVRSAEFVSDTRPCYVLGVYRWTGDEREDWAKRSREITISPRGLSGLTGASRQAAWDWWRKDKLTPLGIVPIEVGDNEQWQLVFAADRLRELAVEHGLVCSIPNVIDD